jgi:DNA-binding MarR family transcriptional regulator
MSDHKDSLRETSREVFDVVLLVMHFVRTQMRRNRASGLSVPQFRSLLFIDRNAGASLGELAQHLGLTSASACRLIDALQEQELVHRGASPRDRRRVTLSLTAAGRRIQETARERTQHSLDELLKAISTPDRQAIARAMPAMRRAFAAGAKGR